METKELLEKAICKIPKVTERRIIVIDEEKSKWPDYLRSFLEETSAQVEQPQTTEEINAVFDSFKAQIYFANPKALSLSMIQKLKVYCETDQTFHLFQIGEEKSPTTRLPFICRFGEHEQGKEFVVKFTKHLKLPENIRILVADDDPEVRELIAEHLEKSVHPKFDVIFAEDGVQAIQKLRKERPDIAILDFKMPRKGGREVYAYIQSCGRKLPVIVFLDLFSSQQVLDLYQFGRPLILDKSGECSSMTNLEAFIKKVFFFGI